MSIPSDIASYLTPDEKMMKIGKSREWEIYVTDKRVLFKKGGVFGKEIVEASYRHISSIEYKKESPWGYIIAGIVLIGFAFILNDLFPSIFEYVGSILSLLIGLIGIILIIASLFITPRFKIHVVGREPLTISGQLEEIIKIIRQYREKVEISEKLDYPKRLMDTVPKTIEKLFCRYCGAENPSKAVFCKRCGKKMVRPT